MRDGEPLSAKLLQALHSLDFVKLHEFLPAPLLRAATGTPTSCAGCHSCHCTHTAAGKQTKTVGHIYMRLMCFHRRRAGLPPSKGFTIPGLCAQHFAGVPAVRRQRVEGL